MNVETNRSSLTELDLWDYPQLRIPERSRLYHLAPLGIGTSEVECFTSYLSRLAAIHHVALGSLISKEIKRFLPKDCTGSGDYNFSAVYPVSRVFNGLGKMAKYWVDTLEHLTLRHDLSSLTMLKWREVLPSHGLMRSERSWCPNCYQEWYKTGQIVYEPLIWTIRAVEICFRHSRKLVNRCPYCGKSLPFLGTYYRVGHCSRCMKWLGNARKETASANTLHQQGELRWQEWVVTNVGELLAVSAEHFPPNKGRVAATLTAFAKKFPKGSVREFADWLQMPFSAMHRWSNSVWLPQLPSVLHICYRLGITLVEFLTMNNDIEDVNPCPPSLDIPSRIKKKKIMPFRNQEKLRRRLEEVLGSDELPPPSMLTVARQLKLAPHYLYSHFPELCRKISAKHTRHRRDRSLKNIDLICEEVKRIVLELHAEGIKPTQMKIRQRMNKCGYLRYEQVNHAIATIKRDLGYEIT